MENILRYFLKIAATLALAVPLSAGAGNIKAASGKTITPVVELYTSEGCSSCPPADAWLTHLGQILDDRFHAVPLAFHVDYWNDLGWEDPFSHPKFTQRQYALAAWNRQHAIYTPEFFVSGRETRGTDAVVEAIQLDNRQLAEVALSINAHWAGRRNVAVDVEVLGAIDGAELYLALTESNLHRRIDRGENRGHELRYDFVVRYFERAALLAGGKYHATHSLALGSGWNADHMDLAVMILDRVTGRTRQALHVPLAEMSSNSWFDESIPLAVR